MPPGRCQRPTYPQRLRQKRGGRGFCRLTVAWPVERPLLEGRLLGRTPAALLDADVTDFATVSVLRLFLLPPSAKKSVKSP